MKTISVLPARMAASRFPGKPMVKIAGMPMIEHCWRRACLSQPSEEVYVATCDQVIFDHIESLGGKAVMTSDQHERCSDRVAEAVAKIEESEKIKVDVVAMLQGDEPLLDPTIFEPAFARFDDPKIHVVNYMGKIKNKEEHISQNVVKVVVSQDNKALYFSRLPVPANRSESAPPLFRQTGIIFFRRDQLFLFAELKPTPYEVSESVDMLRFLEHGYEIQMLETDMICAPIDVPGDLVVVEEYLKKDPVFDRYRS